MAKIYYCILTVLLLSFSSCDRVHKNDLSKDLAVNDTELVSVIESDVVETIPAEESITNEPEVLLEPVKMTLPEIYLSQVGVREATGKNDGPEVEMYLRVVNLGKGYSWCSAFVAWSLNEAEIPHRINAWSPTAENRSNIVYKAKRFISEPEPGDVFTIWYNNLNRIGHTGFYHDRQNESIIVTVEGNTNAQGSREGNGVWKKYRPLKSIHSISRWP